MKLPNVILLNGAPSAGKTQLTLALLARLPFVCMGIDEFIWQRVPASWYPAFAAFLGGPPNVGGEHGDKPAKLFRAFHRAVRVCVDEGFGVVVDDCIVRRDLLDDWVRALDGIDVFFVGAHCLEEELVFRERARRDRPLGSAVAAMKLVQSMRSTILRSTPRPFPVRLYRRRSSPLWTLEEVQAPSSACGQGPILSAGFVKYDIAQNLPEQAVNPVARQSVMNDRFRPKADIRTAVFVPNSSK